MTHPSQGVLTTTRQRLMLLGIILVALGFRLWGIDYGLPYEGMTYNSLTIEESKEVHRAYKVGVGEYVWNFGKGGMFWILFFEFGVYYVVSLLSGAVSDTREFAMRVLEDRTTAYLIGRVTVAFMGAATCLVIYAVGRRLFDTATGLVAAFVGAVAYFHAQFSTVINVDIGMVLFLWGSVLCYLVYEEQGNLRWLLAAGAFAGVSIAFKLPGAVVILLLGAAMLTAPGVAWFGTRLWRDGAIAAGALLIGMTVAAPEWIPWTYVLVAGTLAKLMGSGGEASVDLAKTITTQDTTVSFGYLRRLLDAHNIALTVTAGAAFALGLWRRSRWEILLGALVIVFIIGMSMSDRSQPERYLLPIMPALWLLGARLLVLLGTRAAVSLAAGLLLVVALPVYALLQAGVERMHPDTRLLAKDWIEANVPGDARILMDGMRHRYTKNAPLTPNTRALAKQIDRVATQVEAGEQIGRGVDEDTLRLYREATEGTEGPRYEIHSTEYGLALKAPSHYVASCFDYVVTSSSISHRFAPGSPHRERFPEAAHFYDQLDVDPRFQQVYQAAPEAWNSSGPVITVYRIAHDCGAGEQAE